MTCMYRKEYMQIISEFFEMDIALDAKTKLKAQDEYEKLRDALSLQNMFEAQSQIQSNTKFRIECGGSSIILPIVIH